MLNKLNKYFTKYSTVQNATSIISEPFQLFIVGHNKILGSKPKIECSFLKWRLSTQHNQVLMCLRHVFMRCTVQYSTVDNTTTQNTSMLNSAALSYPTHERLHPNADIGTNYSMNTKPAQKWPTCQSLPSWKHDAELGMDEATIWHPAIVQKTPNHHSLPSLVSVGDRWRIRNMLRRCYEIGWYPFYETFLCYSQICNFCNNWFLLKTFFYFCWTRIN